MSKRTAYICLAVLVVAAGLFVTGHGPHVIGYLPYLVLLACPLMHLFMHHAHQHRADGSPKHSTRTGRENA